MMLEAAMVLVFVTVACGVFVVTRAFFRRRNGGTLEGFRAGLAAQIPQTATAAAGIERDLWRAGRYEPTARRDFLAVRNIAVLFCIVGTMALAIYVGPEHKDVTLRIIIFGTVAAALAYAIPRFQLGFQARRRVRQIESGLPDALDMITMCLAGGLSLQDALKHVALELEPAHPDLAMELAIIRRQAELGTLGQALRHFALRIDAGGVKSLTSMVTQAERLGTNIATALRDYADGLRRTHRQRAEERANKTGIRLLFPLVLCLAPSVFLLIWGPAVLELRSFLVTATGEDGILSQAIPADVFEVNDPRMERLGR